MEIAQIKYMLHMIKLVTHYVPNYSVKNIRIIILYGGITNENFRMDLIEHCLD